MRRFGNCSALLICFILSISVAQAANVKGTKGFIQPIPTSAEQVRPLLNGSKVPDLKLKTSTGKAFNLRAELSQKPAVLIFYRGGWCPFCNLHLAKIRTAVPELLKLGFQIIAISPDIPGELSKTIEKAELEYTLLSDSSMEMAKSFGIAFKVDDGILKKYSTYGINLEAASGKTHHLLPVPAVFIVGTDGKIGFSYVNPDYKVRLSAQMILEAAKFTLGLQDKKIE